MKKVLLVAYHFPPISGSSGIQRTLRFAQHLTACGWLPIVLTANPRAYEHTSPDQQADVPPEVPVYRAFALDTARHLSIAGRYAAAMARPDRWISWRFDAVRLGLRLIRTHQPSAIWSTYPIATAHLIGSALHRKSGLPWIADFRDPMAQDGYPSDPITHDAYVNIERQTLGQARYSVFTTPGALRAYANRYPQWAERLRLIENGYDEPVFQEAERAVPSAVQGGGDRAFTILHSGIVYPSERDPTQLFKAVRQLADAGHLQAGQVRIRFRASAHDGLLSALAFEHGVTDFIDLAPPIPYRAALAEMLQADALLVLQASNCNDQVPAKVYEYFRCRRPIVALTDPAGDTAQVLRQAGVTRMAPLDESQPIAELLKDLVGGANDGFAATTQATACASRMGRTAQLAELLDSLG